MKFKKCYIFEYQSNENRAFHFFFLGGGKPGIFVLEQTKGVVKKHSS